MTTTCDYARLYETEFRPRARLRRTLARVVLAGLFVIAPRTAFEIWRERR